MSKTRRKAKKKHGPPRTALSARNIIEHSMEECKKVEQRNRSLNTKTLKTRPEFLSVVYVSPKPPTQITTEQYPSDHRYYTD